MAWRGLHIAQAARLSLRDRQIVVAQEDGESSFALEDVAWVVLDTVHVSITGSLLSALAESGVTLIVPDSRHHPAGLLLSFHQHHAQTYVAHLQRDLGLPLQKRLWQTLVVAKIRNQAAVLQALNRANAKALFAMARRVGSGDPDNLEAQAAQAYWPSLFQGFTRSNDRDRRNALLNYGYAVMRATLARACVASGLLPVFGVHHDSQSNAFNLVDDLIEPFRPFVDRLAQGRADAFPEGELTVDDRRHMATVLGREVLMDQDHMTILVATEAVATSTVRVLEQGDATLLQTPAWPPENPVTR